MIWYCIGDPTHQLAEGCVGLLIVYASLITFVIEDPGNTMTSRAIFILR